MEEPRAPLQEELPQILEFLKTKLRKDSSWTIEEEYPTAFGPGNVHNLRVIKIDEKILSHAVIKPVIIKTPLAIFKVAPIGSVFTDESHRNQGLSKMVLLECLNNARSQGCDFAILWTDLYDLYRKLGFELAGSEVSYVLQKPLANLSDPSIKIIEGSQVDPQAMLRVYTKHTVASIRTADEIKKFMKIPNTRVFTAWSAGGALLAYAVEGKGADLAGYVHEWGGDTQTLMKLFNHILRVRKEPLTVIVPQHAQNLRRALEPLAGSSHHGYLGMIKILRPEVLAEKAQKAARMTGLKDLEIEWQDEALVLRCGGEEARIKDEPSMIRLFFGPDQTASLFPGSSQLTGQLEKLFPLPLWIWGWDSI